MESKTLAVFDSTLWFIRVGVAAALFVGAMSGAANGQSDRLYPELEGQSNIEVQLVKKLPNRKGRKLEFGMENICAVGN